MFHKNKYFPKLTFFKLSKIIILILLSNQILLAQENWSKNKKAIINSIDEHKGRLIEISDQIWAAAETSLEEFKSSKYLSDYAQENGFSVEIGVAGMPTAFIAKYGSGRPYIGIMGEFDANSGISQ